ncbi:PleD family two-component system response regulator [Hyphomicrobium sp.]|uniref:PleD family two-component system response regulator n=1 Tax=Hyphomicrobium sp. TaxID=82 RepID=UPI002E2F1FFC|nr:PleD family two-component system response regulator [Hyphomicrobium sp.]HEX2842766.1 PleD family two-component system response regulator [Hyphomicrobium sp.]
MTARVLVVDDILANIKLLQARLEAEYFEVLTASNGMAALEICQRERVDVVLLDVMMPGIDGFEVCRRLKASAQTLHIPVVMVTALDQVSDKIQGLDCGADDFLTKPVDDIALVTRVKSLARLKMLNDEMLMRVTTSRQMGLADEDSLARILADRPGRVLVVDDHPRSSSRVMSALMKEHEAYIESDPQLALQHLAAQPFDLVVVALNLQHSDGLRLCSQVRSLDRSRHIPILIMVDPGDEARLLRGLDMGVNDYLMRPVDRHELLARVKTQIKRKRFSDYLRNQIRESVEMSITDPLTGLHNRRYMERHLKTLIADALRSGRSLSVLIADIDHFKLVNDTYGHDAGDLVLKEFSDRFRRYTRGVDLACRLGGEEFLIIMPDTDKPLARQVGERVRECVASQPFKIASDKEIWVTASVGLATWEGEGDTSEALFKRADNALYAAKRQGRNQVVADAA